MQAKVTLQHADGTKDICPGLFDQDDALSSAKQMLKLGKASIVHIQIIGSKLSYRVTKSGMNYNIKGLTQPTL